MTPEGKRGPNGHHGDQHACSDEHCGEVAQTGELVTSATRTPSTAAASTGVSLRAIVRLSRGGLATRLSDPRGRSTSAPLRPEDEQQYHQDPYEGERGPGVNAEDAEHQAAERERWLRGRVHASS